MAWPTPSFISSAASRAGSIRPSTSWKRKWICCSRIKKNWKSRLKAAIQRNAAQTASWLLTRAQDVNGIPLITQIFPDSDADYLQAIADALKGRFKGVVVVGGAVDGAVALIASVSPEFTGKVQAGKIIQQIAPLVGGKGGGRPDNARGGGKDAAKLDAALAKVRSLL